MKAQILARRTYAEHIDELTLKNAETVQPAKIPESLLYGELVLVHREKHAKWPSGRDQCDLFQRQTTDSMF